MFMLTPRTCTSFSEFWKNTDFFVYCSVEQNQHMYTAQKMKKSLMKNFIFCAVVDAEIMARCT